MNKISYKCLNAQEWIEGTYELRTISPAEIQLIREWRNLQMDILRQNNEISQSAQEEYFNKYIWPDMKLEKPKNILLSFYYKKKLIGYGGLVHISWENKNAEISFLLNHSDSANIGIYTEHFIAFLKLIKKISFMDLKFEKIYTETYDIRRHHVLVLEKNGMVLEGIKRRHILLGNKYVDSLMHGILRSEYEK